MGKFREKSIELEVDGLRLTDPQELNDSFANIFVDRVNKLAPDNVQRIVMSHFLRSIGMVVNESKTAVMWLGAKSPLTNVMINDTPVPLTTQIKALGIFVEGDLSREAQANHAITKSKKNALSIQIFAQIHDREAIPQGSLGRLL